MLRPAVIRGRLSGVRYQRSVVQQHLIIQATAARAFPHLLRRERHDGIIRIQVTLRARDEPAKRRSGGSTHRKPAAEGRS